MDKKQINDPKMTVNFLIWVGGVFYARERKTRQFRAGI